VTLGNGLLRIPFGLAHSSCPAPGSGLLAGPGHKTLCRASTSSFTIAPRPRKKDVDGRDKPGHDGRGWSRTAGTRLAVALVLGFIGSAQAQAQDPRAQRGLAFARTHCAQCHSLDKASESPLKIAPPFRSLHQRYPVEALEEALGEGIVTGHPSMPEFRLEPDQIGDFIAFLNTLR
jgi:cytochrome c